MDSGRKQVRAPVYIDRRAESAGRRETVRGRFLERVREVVRRQVDKLISERSIDSIDHEAEIKVPRREIDEPHFHEAGGVREYVRPGNHKYRQGNRISREQQTRSKGKGKATDVTTGEDDYVFHLSRDEFLNIFFEDMGLPNLLRRATALITEMADRRAGFSTTGNPAALSVKRTKMSSKGRRIATRGAIARELATCVAQLEEALRMYAEDDPEIEKIRARIKELQAYTPRGLDPVDARYYARVPTPRPHTRAVVFCLMDVSQSMNEDLKELAKRFFVLLYLFLMRVYGGKGNVEVRFVRYHSEAEECDEHTFFHDNITGGTHTSVGFACVRDIIARDYASGEWNIYLAHASDGDNWGGDNDAAVEILTKDLLPLLQYAAYVQVKDNDEELWEIFEPIAAAHPGHFAMAKATDRKMIFRALRALFAKHSA